LFWIGCSSSDPDQRAGGNAGSAPVIDTYAGCADFCDAGGPLSCTRPSDYAECIRSCNEYSVVCGTAYTAYVDCVGTNGSKCLPNTDFANIDQCAKEFVVATHCTACTPTPSSSRCERCVAEKCCENSSKLFQDPDYVAWLNCFHPCSDTACGNKC